MDVVGRCCLGMEAYGPERMLWVSSSSGIGSVLVAGREFSRAARAALKLFKRCCCNLDELIGLKKPCAVKDGTWVLLVVLSGLCGLLVPLCVEVPAGLRRERFVGFVTPLNCANPGVTVPPGVVDLARSLAGGSGDGRPSSDMAEDISLFAV